MSDNAAIFCFDITTVIYHSYIISCPLMLWYKFKSWDQLPIPAWHTQEISNGKTKHCYIVLHGGKTPTAAICCNCFTFLSRTRCQWQGQAKPTKPIPQLIAQLAAAEPEAVQCSLKQCRT